jgi:hypothetical protein
MHGHVSGNGGSASGNDGIHASGNGGRMMLTMQCRFFSYGGGGTNEDRR